MRRFYLLYFTILFCVSNMACKKESAEKLSEGQDLIDSSKVFFENEVIANIMSNPVPANTNASNNNKKNPRKSLLRIPIWSKAYTAQLSSGKVVVVPVHHKIPFLINTTFSGNRIYSVDDLTKLLIYKDGKGKFHGELITFFPDSNYQKGSAHAFSGIVFVENWQGEFINRFKYTSSGKILGYNLTHLSRNSLSSQGSAQGLDMIVICYESYGYNYSADDPDNGYYWEESLGCQSYFFEGGGTGGGGGNLNGSDYGNMGGGGGGFNSTSTFTVTGGNNTINDFNQYTHCFTNTPGNTHNYTITLCVSQPEAGSRESWGFSGSGSSASSNPISVGHTFFILTETTSTSRTTRNVGFYPASDVNPLSPISQGQLNNDANHDYDIAVNITVTSSEFTQVLNFLSQGNTPGFLYDLNTNNCTTFALNALGVAGINLPRTNGSWLNGSGLNPGDLGEDLRIMPLPSTMTRTTLTGMHRNAGFCN